MDPRRHTKQEELEPLVQIKETIKASDLEQLKRDQQALTLKD